MNGNERLLPERRAALRLLATGMLGAGGMAGVLRAALAANPRRGMRSSVKGEVTIDGKPAQSGQQVRPGQTVRTAAGGEAVFVIGNNAFLQRENSEFAVDASAGVMTLRYISGRVLSVFGKGKKRLDTPTAIIGIRGTACYIEAGAALTYCCLCYGSAVITAKANPHARRIVRTRHHESPFYIDGAGEKLIRPAKASNHTDDELIMLEELVGRRPPFYGKEYEEYEEY